MKHMVRALYRGWMRFAHALGRIQTFLVLSVIYFIAVGITAPFLRLFSGDPLDRRMGGGGSAWAPRANANLTIEEARRLF